MDTAASDTFLSESSSEPASHTSLEPPKKVAILMLNLGGPDTLDAVEPFLYNLFSDPDIFKLPLSFLLQKPLALAISKARSPKVRNSYHEIGGGSPILRLTQEQARNLEATLKEYFNLDAKVYLGMRYWKPFTEHAIREMQQDGVTEAIVLPLYPQYSVTTTGSSMNEVKRWMEKLNYHPQLSVIPPFFDHPAYKASIAEIIQDGLDSHDWGCEKKDVTVLFSAHSLPKKFVIKNKDPYPEQIMATCRTVMQEYFPNQLWELAYQSKVGNLVWLGPQTDGILHYFSATSVDNILMVPISFVSDHLETLFEIDLEYIPLAHQLGLKHVVRSPGLNSRPTFIKTLAKLVKTQLDNKAVPTMMVS
jgi:protoporphyrin/coproporphyrin ferrochelatase